MKWNRLVGGILIGLAFGLFLGVAIVDLAQHWYSNTTLAASMLLVATGVAASGIARHLRGRQPDNRAGLATPDARKRFFWRIRRAKSATMGKWKEDGARFLGSPETPGCFLVR
jgi:hypothetical protein